MNSFLLIAISFFSLLAVASYTSVLAKKTRLPYTVFLFLIGIFIVVMGKYFPVFSIFTKMELSKDLVFFIFLPTLIFESGYNTPYKKILRDITPITGLAIGSLVISTLVIGIALKILLGLFGFDVPYLATFLFGAIISATDPVAVLAIFKEVGVPKRILYIFEAESLFNDGTGVALFLVIMGIIEAGTGVSASSLFSGTISFLVMIFGGALFGLFMGWLFSTLIKWVKHSWAELTLTLLLAHTTFILSEIISSKFEAFDFSAIIATTIAAITLGNYGRYKISTEVREMMDTFWEYLAFISNSLIFLLMGLMIGSIDFHIKTLLVPIIVTIAVVIVARIISVVGVIAPLNYFIKFPISKKWQTLIAWGSLRGAIAITMLLFLSSDMTLPGWTQEISVKDFISVLVISCIVFTLVVKAMSMKLFVKKLGLSDLTKEEEFTYHQMKEILDKSVIESLKNYNSKKYVSKDVTNYLLVKYKLDDEKEKQEIKKCQLKKNEFENILRRYALGIERRTILEAFESKQVDERTLKKILNKIEEQYMRIELGISQIKEETEKKSIFYITRKRIKRFWKKLTKSEEELLIRDYVYNRSRALISEHVLEQLKGFQEKFYSNEECDKCFEDIIERYEEWSNKANKNMYKIEAEIKKSVHIEERKLLNNHLVYTQEDLVEQLYSKHIMNGKVKNILIQSVRETED